jgi:hypothetical protein
MNTKKNKPIGAKRRYARRTHRYKTRRHKGGEGEEDDYSVATIKDKLAGHFVEKQLRDDIKGEQVTDGIRNKLHLKSKLKLRPGISSLLQLSCKNAGNCLALGVYGDTIKTFFDNFNDLTLVDNKTLRRIGSPSANGFVIEVPFVKDGYTSYTALKCSAKKDADNLFYEWFVGAYFINRYIKKYPCFVETYDCYYYSSDAMWDKMLHNATTKSFVDTNLSQMIVPMAYSKNVDKYNEQNKKLLFNASCAKNKLLCVLIQHFDNVRSFNDEYTNNFDNIKYDVYNLMYQIYFPLCML